MTETVRRVDELPRQVAKLQRAVDARSLRGHGHLLAVQLWTRAEQTILNNAVTQWGFNVSEFDAGSTDLWSNSGGDLTVNAAGIYRLNFGFRWAADATITGRRFSDVLVDGTSVVRHDENATQVRPAEHIGRLVSLPVGAVVTCDVLQSSGGSLGFGGDEMTFFSIEAVHLT